MKDCFKSTVIYNTPDNAVAEFEAVTNIFANEYADKCYDNGISPLIKTYYDN